MGKPQPLNTFEQNIPSFEPSTIKAIKIQRVTLPEKQQFINKPPVFRRRGYVDCSETEKYLRFYLSTNIIFKKTGFCVGAREKKRKNSVNFVA